MTLIIKNSTSLSVSQADWWQIHHYILQVLETIDFEPKVQQILILIYLAYDDQKTGLKRWMLKNEQEKN